MDSHGTLRIYLYISVYNPVKEIQQDKRLLLLTAPGIYYRDVEPIVTKQRDITPDCVCIYAPDPVHI